MREVAIGAALGVAGIVAMQLLRNQLGRADRTIQVPVVGARELQALSASAGLVEKRTSTLTPAAIDTKSILTLGALSNNYTKVR